MSDLDGTLLNEQKQISLRNQQAIHNARKQGIRFGISTGRPLSAVSRKIKEWGIEAECDFLIGMNGGQIQDCKTGKREQLHLLDHSYVKEIIDHFQGWNVNFIVYDGDAMYYLKEDETTKYLHHLNGLTPYLVDETKLLSKDYPKLLLSCDPKQMERVMGHAKQLTNEKYRHMRTQPFLYEFLDTNVSKSEGIQKAVAWYGGTLDEVLAFGDTSNDNEMIRDCGIGVCMANGTEDTKALADAICESNEADGVAKYIEQFLKEREVE